MIPVTIIGRPLLVRGFVCCGLVPELPVDLRKCKGFGTVQRPTEGRDYPPGTYVERWHA